MKKMAIASALLMITTIAFARDQVKIVASSAIYPLVNGIAEAYGSVTRYPSPVVESMGTNDGIKLFCSDNGLGSPDIVSTNRRMKVKEFRRCKRNGVDNITEVMFGGDGIVVAQATKNDIVEISKRELLLALAKKVPNKDDSGLVDNPYRYWDEINPRLPHRKISIFGPAPGSDTRDTFEETVLAGQTKELKSYRDAGFIGYRTIRADGTFVPSSADGLILKKLTGNTEALGIFGYSFLKKNSKFISGLSIDGVAPTANAISSEAYPFSRKLFFYIKNDHAKDVPAIREYVEIFADADLVGKNGLLAEMGLVPLPNDVFAESRQKILNLQRVKIKELEAIHGS